MDPPRNWGGSRGNRRRGPGTTGDNGPRTNFSSNITSAYTPVAGTGSSHDGGRGNRNGFRGDGVGNSNPLFEGARVNPYESLSTNANRLSGQRNGRNPGGTSSSSSFPNQSRELPSLFSSFTPPSEPRPSRNGNNMNNNRNRSPSNNSNSNFNSSQQQSGAEGTHNPKKKFEGPVFGFKRLYNFLSADTDADDVITNLYRNIKDWEILLENDSIAAKRTLRNGSQEMSDDFLVLIVLLLGEKVCSDSTVLSNKQISIISSSSSSANFLTKIEEKCKRLTMNGTGSTRRAPNNEMTVDQSPARFLKSLSKFFRFVATKMKTTALDFLNKIFPSVFGTLFTLNALHPSEDLSALIPDFNELKGILGGLQKEAERKVKEDEFKSKRRYNFLTPEEDEEIHGMAPPDDYREIPIVPTMEEIFSCQETFLRTNKLNGAYTDANHYLDVQYRLLREDFVRPLKKGIQDFMKNKADYLSNKKKFPIGEIRIYREVHYAMVKLVRGSMIHFMQLHPSNYQKIKWDKSKRLLTGSLLVFTPDDFVTAYFAVVHQRDENDLKQGLLAVTWEGLQPELSKENEFLMVECEVYFEAYRHTLQILKEIELEKFPMAKFIVQASSEVGPPKYLLENRHLLQVGQYSCSPLEDNTWPSASDLKLDDKQFAAYKACLTKEFVIVQGPPGTGKTFLALQVVEALLCNTNTWRTEGGGVGPILVVCYTNHALDQFLEGILEVFKKTGQKPSMIRVGGRCKTESLVDFSLMRQRNIASKMQVFDRNYKRMQAEAHNGVRKAEYHRADVMTELLALNNLGGIVDFHSLSVSEELLQEIPTSILEAIQNLSWFGLDERFEEANLSDENRLRQYFKLQFSAAPATQQQKKQTIINIPSTHNRNQQNSDSDSDGDDYDVDELQQNRVIDEIYTQAESSAPRDVGSNLRYLFNQVKREMLQSIDALEKEKEMIRALKDMSRVDREFKIGSLNAGMEKHRKHLVVVHKKESFIQAVLAAHKNKMLDLPNVERYFKQSEIYKISVAFATTMTIATKWAVFFYVLERAKKLTAAAVKIANDLMTQAQKELQEVYKYGDGKLLARSTIVGMTTTGAAKYNDLLRMAKSRIVIVEEAAEVLESHIVTCITPTCQQLILIGDHQQLRPSTTVYELATDYHLDISLFERMVKNQLNCYKINVQHRMRPEIANLVVGTIYPELFNAPRVHLYPPVSGVISNLFFISHEEAESSESDTKSKSNKHEAKFMASFCRYLIQQGYKNSQITILTTYTGQMFLIKQCMREFATCLGVRVTCVDNFQGEENDIILLSLVRSNNEGNIGFLKTDNRICVAISRAKHGLFIIGNMKKLAKRSPTWKKIEEKLNNRSEIGPSLTIECQLHGTIADITKDSDFQKSAPEGGCKNPCGAKLKCDHDCDAVCHIQDREHLKHKCKLACKKSCPSGHGCAEPCFKACPPCPVKVLKTLTCGHQITLMCHIPEDSITCHVLVEKELPCGHKETLACFVDPRDYKCKEKVNKTLPCEHVKEAECFVDPTKITCKIIVEKKLPCGHSQDANCWKREDMIQCESQVEVTFPACGHKTLMKCKLSKKPDIKCKSNCTVRLECGHACTLICHTQEDPEHIHFECKKPCMRLCPNGEHRCKSGHACHLKCPPCKTSVEKKLDCGHKANMDCDEKPENILCQLPCTKTLNCGHYCQSLCYETCDDCQVTVEKIRSYCGHKQAMACSVPYTAENCEVKVKLIARSVCGHDGIKVPCKLSRTIKSDECLKYCENPCNFLFRESEGGCGHCCKGTCSSCLQSRIHIKCKEKCGKTLVCGHVCDFPCSQTCPPCQKGCDMECGHSKCSATCGQPCNPCGERCQWKCVHKQCNKLCSDKCDREPCTEPCSKKIAKCGHECIGFCGEPCPPQCIQCDRTELVEDFFTGYEDEVDARFVLLEDCGHAIVSDYLDYHMINDIVDGEIKAKECPRCKTLIRKSLRYGNILKTRLKDVVDVKRKTFGNMKEIQKTQMELFERMKINRVLEGLFPEARNYVLSALGKEVYSVKFGNRFIPNRVDASRMASVDLITKHLEDACDVVTKGFDNTPILALQPPLRADLVNRFTTLFHTIICRQLPFSSVEIRDFDHEFERLFDLKQIYLRKSFPNFTLGHTRASLVYTTLERIVLGPQVYTRSLKAEVHELIEELEKVLKTGLGISDRERREILDAINLRGGRWFKCPNGHVYIITECGGAMVESKCNECGAIIGGGNHRLRSDNALATEMDGATQPLWPNMV